MVSELDNCAYSVPSTCGETFVGFRFQPAVRIDEQSLWRRMAQCKTWDVQQIEAMLPDHMALDERLHEALAVLSGFASVAMASRSMGVSERTLERLVQTATSRTPMFWKSLARVRRSARAVATGSMTLAQVAADHGYADQAHMSREFKRWFGVTPAAFAQQTQMKKTIHDSGYGD